MTMLFAAYVRTSTDDHQSPDDSRRWQLSVAEQLIAPHGQWNDPRQEGIALS